LLHRSCFPLHPTILGRAFFFPVMEAFVLTQSTFFPPPLPSSELTSRSFSRFLAFVLLLGDGPSSFPFVTEVEESLLSSLMVLFFYAVLLLSSLPTMTVSSSIDEGAERFSLPLLTFPPADRRECLRRYFLGPFSLLGSVVTLSRTPPFLLPQIPAVT